MAASGFAELLAKPRHDRGSGPRLLTPEDPDHAWCAVARPLVLSAEVSRGCASGAGDGSSVVQPLLPLIFEKLLGRPLDAAPWGAAALRVFRRGADDDKDSCSTASFNAELNCQQEGDQEMRTGDGHDATHKRTDEVLRVDVALASPPSADIGLFEIATPLGGPPVSLRLLGLQDSADMREGSCIGTVQVADMEDPVVLLTLPSDWFKLRLVRKAWDEKVVQLGAYDDYADHGDTDEDESEDGGDDSSGQAERERTCSGSAVLARREEGWRRRQRSARAWLEWFGQWGEVTSLQLSAHAFSLPHADESRAASNKVLLAVAFADGADACARCAAALGDGRMLVLKDPARAAFPRAVCAPREHFETQAEQAWREHLHFEQEMVRIDRALVLADAAYAVPSTPQGCFGPLAELVERWICSGTVHASPTICGQRRLQEAETSSSSRSRPPEDFRRACWHAAYRVVLQVRPPKDDGDTMALALCEHWRKAHGIYVDPDAADLTDLVETLQEVWLSSSREEDAMREAAEARARAAEEALLEELEEEESRASRADRVGAARKEKKKQKERQRKKAAAKQEPKPSNKAPAAGQKHRKEATGEKPPAKQGDEEQGGERQKDVEDEVEAAEEDDLAWTLVANSKKTMLEELLGEDNAGSDSGGRHTTNLGSTSTAKSGRKGRRTSKKSAPQADKRDSSPPLRRPSNIESILEAVRKSEELHRHSHSPLQPAPGSNKVEKDADMPPASGTTSGGPTTEASSAAGSSCGVDVVLSAPATRIRRWSSASSASSREEDVDQFVAASTSVGVGSEAGSSASSPGVSTPRLVAVQPAESAASAEVVGLEGAAIGANRNDFADGGQFDTLPQPTSNGTGGARADASPAAPAAATVSTSGKTQSAAGSFAREVVTWGDLGDCVGQPVPLATRPPPVATVAMGGSPPVATACSSHTGYGTDAAARGTCEGYAANYSPHAPYAPYAVPVDHCSAGHYWGASEYGGGYCYGSGEQCHENPEEIGGDGDFEAHASMGQRVAGSRRSARRRQRKRRSEEAAKEVKGESPLPVSRGDAAHGATPGASEVASSIRSLGATSAGDVARPRNVVTCHDLGLDLFATPRQGAAHVGVKALPQVPPLPGTPAAAADSAPVPATPSSVCQGSVPSLSKPSADALMQQPCSPCSPSAPAAGPRPQSIMTTFPMLQSPSCGARAAGDASQRMSPSMAASLAAAAYGTQMLVSSPSQDRSDGGTDALGRWLQANCLTSPCGGSDPLTPADIAAQLRAVEPEAYED